MLEKKEIKRQMILAIKNTNSMSAASRLLKINYKTFRKYTKEFNIFIPNQGSKGGFNNKIDVESYLNNDTPISSGRLKKLLLNRGILENRCQGDGCEINYEWLGRKIVLELDHIDGDNKNNNLNNLRLLCPNCHSQTPTFRGRNLNKNVKKYNDDDVINAFNSSLNINQMLSKLNLVNKGANYKTIRKILKRLNLEFVEFKIPNIPSIPKIKKERKKHFCDCGKEITSDAKQCDVCYKKSIRKVERPPLKQLIKEINELGYRGAGRKYDVSDNSIRKWKKYYEK